MRYKIAYIVNGDWRYVYAPKADSKVLAEIVIGIIREFHCDVFISENS